MIQRHTVKFSYCFPILRILTQRRLQTFSSSNRNATINHGHVEALSELKHKGVYLKDSPRLSIVEGKSYGLNSLDASTQDAAQNLSPSVEVYEDHGATLHYSPTGSRSSGASKAPIVNTTHGKGLSQLHQCTVLDFSTPKSDIKEIKSYFKTKFPRLRLCIEHSEGKDVQGSKTHAISLYLAENMLGGSLSAEEASALSKFKGDSIGVSYFGTLKRSLRQACAVAGLPPLPDDLGKNQISSTSLLSLYLEALRATCTSLKIQLKHDTYEGEKRVRITIQDGEDELALTHGGEQFTLRLLSQAVEAAAMKKESMSASKVEQRIASFPLVVVLPDRNVRLKQVLQRLLNYHYGVPEDHIFFETQALTDYLFKCNVVVRLPANIMAADGATTRNIATEISMDKFVMGFCSANNKKLSESFACVQVLKDHFSRIFEEQIGFHPEVKELMEQAKKMQHTVAAPHVSQGLARMLNWALQREGKRYEVVFTLLQPNRTYSDLGVHTQLMCWRICLNFLGDGNSEQVVVAYDEKKKRGEQKAIASALAKRFEALCAESIAYAQSQDLIDADGSPTPCEAVDFDVESNAVAAQASEQRCTDPFLGRILLLPVQSLAPAPPPSEPSLLSLFRLLSVPYAQEELRWDEERSLWTASLYTAAGPKTHSSDTARAAEADSAENSATQSRTLLLSSTSHIQTCALSRVFSSWVKKMTEGQCSDAEMALLDFQAAQDTIKSIKALLGTLPRVLAGDRIVESVLTSVGKLYGVGVQMRVRTLVQYTSVELWGYATESIGLESEDSVSVVGKPSDGKETPSVPETQPTCYVFLGQGCCSSLDKAVIQCCCSVHAAHILPCLGAFAGVQLFTFQQELVVDQQSKLAGLVKDVVTEIKLTSCNTACIAKLTVHYNRFSKTAFKVELSIVSKEKEVVMETVQANDFVSALQVLCRNISAEFGSQFEAAKPVGPMLIQMPAAVTLKKRCENTLGLPVKFETVLFEGEWHCRVVLELDARHRYCLAEESATRKKEALDAAASLALETYFGTSKEGSTTSLNSASVHGNYLYAID